MSTPRKHGSERIKQIRASIKPVDRAKIYVKMALSALIGDAIEAKFASKGEFADQIGVKRSLVSRWLGSDHNFTVDTLVEIGVALDIQLLNLHQFSEKKASLAQIGSASVSGSTPEVHPTYAGGQPLFSIKKAG